MTEQAHKGARVDAAKRRREYLRKKAKVIIPAIITGCLSILLVGFVLKLALQRHTMSDSQFAAFVLSLVLMAPCTIAIIYCEKKALSIPYVPPVSERIADLPAEEILVRGSDQPAASSDELLRAAREGAATNTDELLRVEDRAQ